MSESRLVLCLQHVCLLRPHLLRDRPQLLQLHHSFALLKVQPRAILAALHQVALQHFAPQLCNPLLRNPTAAPHRLDCLLGAVLRLHARRVALFVLRAILHAVPVPLELQADLLQHTLQGAPALHALSLHRLPTPGA